MKGFRPDKKIIGFILKVGVPSIAMMSIGSIMNFFMNQILLAFTATAAAVMKLFRDLVEKEDVTIVMTTHDVGLMSAGTLSYELEDGAVKTDAVQE